MVSTANRRCPNCFGESFHRGTSDVTRLVNGAPVVLRSVPGSICDQCGYVSITAKTAKRIEKMLDDGIPNAIVAAYEYDLKHQIQDEMEPRTNSSVTMDLVIAHA